MDDTQSIAQLAQFSSVQAATQLKDSFSTFESNFSVAVGRFHRQSGFRASDRRERQHGDRDGYRQDHLGLNGLPAFTLVDKSGALVTDGTGNPVRLPTSAILSIG